jgi:hypothetical protein
MIHTTIPIPKQQAAPDTFHTRKIADQAPAPVYESRISIISACSEMKILVWLSYLWAVVAAKLLEKTVSITTHYNTLVASIVILPFLPVPSLIVSFRDYNETTRNLLGEVGFSLQSSGRYKYAKEMASHPQRRFGKRRGKDWAYWDSSHPVLISPLKAKTTRTLRTWTKTTCSPDLACRPSCNCPLISILPMMYSMSRTMRS